VAIAGPRPAPIRVQLSNGGACSHEEFAGVHRDDAGEGVIARGVTCPLWVATVAGDRAGTLLVARCERDTCGPLLEWRVEKLDALGPPQVITRSPGWPRWATWTLLGIGAATATSVVLIAAGVFETRPVEQRFVVGGVRQE
jgi:hypothetical protein